MSAGKRSHRFAFEKRRADVSDGYGTTLEDWHYQFTAWASRQWLRGGEDVMASRLEGRKLAVINVLASSQTRQVTSDWRIRDTRTDDVFNIRTVETSADRSEIDFLVENGVAHG